ncbi:hypothetical protein [Halorubrum sp. N11]
MPTDAGATAFDSCLGWERADRERHLAETTDATLGSYLSST